MVQETEYENNPERHVAVEEKRPTVVEDLEGEEEFLEENEPTEPEENTNANTAGNNNNYTTRSGRRVQPTSTYIPNTKGDGECHDPARAAVLRRGYHQHNGPGQRQHGADQMRYAVKSFALNHAAG